MGREERDDKKLASARDVRNNNNKIANVFKGDKGYVGWVERKGYGRGRDRATPVWRCLERPPFCTLPTSGSGDSKCP